GSQVPSKIDTGQSEVQSIKVSTRGQLITRLRLEITPEIETWKQFVSYETGTVMQIQF
ncbi:hypothetical protein P7K49_039309, partial [Saguinus oedipus]